MAQTGYTPILIYSSTTASQAPAAGNLTNSTLGSELAINITDGKLFYKDNANAVQVIGWKTTPTTAGGTGLTSYTAGDLLYYATGTTLSKLAIGTSGQWLGSSGTAPQWNSPAALTKTDDTNVTLTLGGSASTALLNAASLTLGWTGQLAVTRGGTGLTSYTAGDLLYYASGTTLSKLAIGASTTILTSSGTAPQWSAASGITVGTATNIAGGAAGSVPYQTGAGATSLLAIGTAYYMLGVNAGGTAPSWQPSATSVLTTQGDLLYASAANTLARLAKNTTASRYLSNSGTSNNPAWAQVDLTNGVTGTLPVGNGGTGATTFTAGRILFGNTTSAINTSANLFWDNANGRLGVNTSSPAYAADIRGGDLIVSRGTSAAADASIYFGSTTNNYIYSGNANNIMAFATNGSERQRIHASGGVSIGNTTDPGATNLSVTGTTKSARFFTDTGDTSAANNTATTIFTMPTLAQGLYLVQAALGNNAPATFTAVSLIRQGNGTSDATALSTATSMTISVTGLNIQATQTSGGTATISWSVTRFA